MNICVLCLSKAEDEERAKINGVVHQWKVPSCTSQNMTRCFTQLLPIEMMCCLRLLLILDLWTCKRQLSVSAILIQSRSTSTNLLCQKSVALPFHFDTNYSAEPSLEYLNLWIKQSTYPLQGFITGTSKSVGTWEKVSHPIHGHLVNAKITKWQQLLPGLLIIYA